MAVKLGVEQLYWRCEPTSLGGSSTDEIEALNTIIGQERAVRALRFGLDIRDQGFNIYAAGAPGTGRTTTIQRYLDEFASQKPTPDDWVYVNNFHDPLYPQVIKIPAGKARLLKHDLERLVQGALSDLQAAFDSDEYSKHREDLVNNIQRQKQEILSNLNREAQQNGFVLQPTPMGLLTIPVKAGEPLSEEDFMKLSEEEREEIGKRQQKLKLHLDNATHQAQNLDKQLREALEKLDQQVAEYSIQHHFDELKEKYQEPEEIPHYIEHVREDILEHISDFVQSEEDENQPSFLRRPRLDPIRKYGVNVLVDNAEVKGAPVVLELNPTYNNLIGKVEHEAVFGALITDFTLIRAGALHRANGGYLVLPVEDLLRNPYAWEALTRSLANQQIEIEEVGERLGFSTKSLRPTPIPLDTKVVLVGRPDLYELLLSYDEKFSELFKVKAEFDSRMDRSEMHIHEYARFISRLCHKENMNPFDQQAMARLIEHAARLTEDQTKLSTRFGDISDVMREACYYAAQENAKIVTAEYVDQAIDERLYRSGMIRDRLQEMITRGVIKINVSGEQVGQANGLSVLSLGDISFGQPSRITVSLGLGKDGVIDIEREAELGGPIHTKGVLILSGYLAEKYTQDKPLSLSARLVFEQNYSGVDGDSASSTELYALLSALSGLPIKQSIAVTGSVNQKGEVQAIGGVNEKIEGYFEVCQATGLTGEQGVMIPSSNIDNLMLKQDVRQAVADGKFNIWSVDTIDEGIELLTGVNAGTLQTDGSFEPDSVNAKVSQRLEKLAETIESFGKEDSE